MLPLPALSLLLLIAMTSPVAECQILPVFNLEKFWNAYMALLMNPMAAMTNPAKGWNDMMGAWVVPGSGPSTPSDKPKTDVPVPKPTDAASRQGSDRIDISPEAALALAVFRREHQMHGHHKGNKVSASEPSSEQSIGWINRTPFFGNLGQQIPAVSTMRNMPYGLPMTLGGGGGGLASPVVSQPFFYVMKGHKTEEDSSEDQLESSRHHSHGPHPVIITSQPFAPPFVGQPFVLPRLQPIQVSHPHHPSHQNVIVNQGSEGQQSLITRGGYGSHQSISIIQT